MPALLSDIKWYKQLNIKYTKLKRSCQGADLPGEPWLEERGLVTSHWAPGTVWGTKKWLELWVLDSGKRGLSSLWGPRSGRCHTARGDRGTREEALVEADLRQ